VGICLLIFMITALTSGAEKSIAHQWAALGIAYKSLTRVIVCWFWYNWCKGLRLLLLTLSPYVSEELQSLLPYGGMGVDSTRCSYWVDLTISKLCTKQSMLKEMRCNYQAYWSLFMVFIKTLRYIVFIQH
jgi:hypothetical protein